MNNNAKLKHIAIAGNIGAGKTTLCELLAEHYHWVPMFEDASSNPYLHDFYNQMKRWAFNLQIYFLNTRYNQILQIRNGDVITIQDRTIYEDAYIFAPNLYEMNLLSKRDYHNYLQIFETMSANTKPPDLLIYLRASIPTLVHHIQTRGREYEGRMSLDYLKRLNEKYESWIQKYTIGNLLLINVDKLDYQNNRTEFDQIIKQIDNKLFI